MRKMLACLLAAGAVLAPVAGATAQKPPKPPKPPGRQGVTLHLSAALVTFSQPVTSKASVKGAKAGVGVGLHLARQMVVEHGGILWADPIPGGGTRAAFCIPSQAGQRLAVRPAGAA